MDFGFEIVRLWERAAEELLVGPLGVTPLAVLGALPAGADLLQGLTGVANRLIDRLEREAPIEQRKLLLTSAFLLSGLRVPRNDAKLAFAGVRAMRESDTYMAIIDEGREIHARSVILRLGKRRLGTPNESIVTHLEGITDIALLDRLIDRLVDASSWQDLLETP